MADRAAEAVPYPPSAVNRLFAAVDRLPGGGWLFYPLLFVAEIVYLHAFLWMTGHLAVGSFAPDAIPALPYGPFTLAAVHYLSRVASRAIAEFRPASGMTDEVYALRRYELITMPAGRIWVALLIGSAIALGTILSAPAAAIAPYGGTPQDALLALGPAALLGYTTFPIAVYQTVRQLRLVERFHREATDLDLFNTTPLYAFSRFTVQVGLTYVLVGYYSLTVNGSFQAGNAIALAVLAGAVVVGFAAFVLPLRGIHSRLVAEKAALMRAANLRFQTLSGELYRRVDAATLTGVKDVTDALGGVLETREIVRKLPTWPWPPEVLRGFLSAVLLPVVVYLITRSVGTVVR
jgi:hypothetical protein